MKEHNSNSTYNNTRFLYKLLSEENSDSANLTPA